MREPDEARQRTVRFHGRVQFKTIRHVADFSDDDITAGWYCKKDFMRMSDEVAEIAKLLAQGQESYKGEELCIRGLEHLVEEDVADYRAEKMIASIDAVLDEQDEQLDANMYDPAVIAKIYSDIVAPLMREAYLIGLRDAKEGAAAAALIPDLSVSGIQMITEEAEMQPQQPEGLDKDPGGEKQPQHNEEPEIDAGIRSVEVKNLTTSSVATAETYDDDDEVPASVDENGESVPEQLSFHTETGEKQAQQEEKPQLDPDEAKQRRHQGEPEKGAGIRGMAVRGLTSPENSVGRGHKNDKAQPDVVENRKKYALEDPCSQQATVDDTVVTAKTADSMDLEDFSGSEQTCDLASAPDEGEEKLNTSLNSMTMEAHPEKATSASTASGVSSFAEVLNQKPIQSTISVDTSRNPPARKPSRRKNFDRKSGTEMSPFVFRRDGTIGFRNYDVEHRKREQSKLRKDCVKSALFNFLDDEAEQDEDFARFLAKSDNEQKEKRSKLYAVSFPNKNKAKSRPSSSRTSTPDARSPSATTSTTGTTLSSHPKKPHQNNTGSNNNSGMHVSMSTHKKKKNASPQGGWSKIVAKNES
jgi:hypothetical protein